MKRQITLEGMLARMAGLCAGSEQCSADIREKVLKKGFSSDVADKIIAYLVKNKYIDDSRFAKALASDKVRFSGWGKIKIRLYLRGKQISEGDINLALDYIDDEDYSVALSKALAAKARSLNLSDAADRMKLYRHLVSRGFESSLIINQIKKYMKHDGDA